jgi:GMC oxidoreductase
MIVRGRDLPERDFDVCLVGAGPVGLAAALECEAQGLSVLLLESGEVNPRKELTNLSAADDIDPRHHAPMEIAVCRAFGGTSWYWGGRCVPFDDIDFEVRDYVPNSGWPLGKDDLKPWLAAATNYLDAGQDVYSCVAPGWDLLSSDVLTCQLERWSRQPVLGRTYRRQIQRSKAIEVRLGHTVTGFSVDNATGNLNSLVVAADGFHSNVRARQYVLACGGLETTRLLLILQRSNPKLFGGTEGPLGRYYMGHIFGQLANLVLTNPTDVGILDFNLDESETYCRRRLSLTSDLQRRENLLNAAFWIDNPPFHDHQHRNSVLSLIFLALSIPSVGRRLLPEGIRRIHVGSSPAHYLRHLLNVLATPHQTVATISNIVARRYLARTRKPGFLLQNASGNYALKFHSEHIPRADSRVSLSSATDPVGMPRISIDVRHGKEEADSIVRSHELLDLGLRARNKGWLKYLYPQADLVQHILENSSDGFHQIGTTRMGSDPANSVVDSDCRTHDIKNLYVTSSSVFPTSGQANPTLMAAVLAVRLAHHLAQLDRSSRDLGSVSDHTRQPEGCGSR